MPGRIDRVDLRAVMNTDGEGGLGPNVVPVEKIVAIPTLIGEVRIATLVDCPDSESVVRMVSEGGPANGQF